MAEVVILAGPSGSGKSHLAERLGWTVLRLDDFYHPHHHPDLPMSSLGIADWDDVGSWDLAGAMVAISELCREGSAQVPVYDIATSDIVGTHTVTATGDRFIAEGLFAPDIVSPCREAGLLSAAICLTRPRVLVFALRFVRDLREARKPPTVLLRRGWRLLRAQPQVVAAAIEAGCEPMNPRVAYRRLTTPRRRTPA